METSLIQIQKIKTLTVHNKMMIYRIVKEARMPTNNQNKEMTLGNNRMKIKSSLARRQIMNRHRLNLLQVRRNDLFKYANFHFKIVSNF